MIKYLNGTKKKYPTCSAGDLKVIKWYVDAGFAVHPHFKSLTGAIMTMGQREMQSVYSKQKINTSISTEDELVGIYYRSVNIFWSVSFI